MHIYLSVGKKVGDKRICPKTGKENNMMRYRGEATGEHDDPESFKDRMDRGGHIVEIHDYIVGSMNPESGHIEYSIGTKF